MMSTALLTIGLSERRCVKLKRISSVVAASLLAVVAVIGLLDTAKASLTSYTNLCVLDNGSYVCAYSQGTGNTILMLPSRAPGLTLRTGTGRTRAPGT